MSLIKKEFGSNLLKYMHNIHVHEYMNCLSNMVPPTKRLLFSPYVTHGQLKVTLSVNSVFRIGIMTVLSIIFMDIYIGLDGFGWYEESLFSGITCALIQYTRTPMKFTDVRLCWCVYYA